MTEENKIKNNLLNSKEESAPILEIPQEAVLEEIKSEKEVISKIEYQKIEEFEQKILDIARVTRVTAGGKRFSFRVSLVIGNNNGKVGFGVSKGVDIAQAVEKAFKQAKKNLIDVKLKNDTIPFEVKAKFNSAVVLLKPAPKGSGVKAGGPVRVIAKLAGIKDISSKIISRTTNKINIAKATIEALKKLKKR